MILKYLSAVWTAFAPVLGNHLWQSTLIVLVAGSLTLVLRNDHARIRYALWFAASIKFLIPFSLLSGIGSLLASSSPSAGAKTGLYFAMQQVGQPFEGQVRLVTSQAAPATTSWSLIHLLPVLPVVWLCGFLTVAFVWYMRWRRISAAVRHSVPLDEGREAEAVRRVESATGMANKIKVFLSPDSLEPGIFGIVTPVLIWPERISSRLDDAHLEAILAHELFHVRRRDNLAAAMHMLVAAIFWFHPLVWWLGVRLVAERERACDEAVLESGRDRQTYAESILKICEFCVESPLNCVSGVTGADLKNRIARIMSARVARKLDFSKKLLLGTAGLVAIAVPIVFGLLNATQSRAASRAQNTLATTALTARSTAEKRLVFDVASVKLNRSINQDSSMNVPVGPEDVYFPNGGLFSGTNVRLISYIYFAYNITGNQFQLLMPQLPRWVIEDRFDIQARADGNTSKAQMRLMMQSLLADRFKLAIHYETRQLPVFGLVLAQPGKTGPQLQPHRDDPSCSSAPPPTSAGSLPESPATIAGGFPTVCGGIEAMPSSPSEGRLRVGARKVPIGLLATALAQMGNLDRPVLDRTGLSGTFDLRFEWTPQHNGPGTPGANTQVTESGPTFLEDLQQQLGLKLVSEMGPVDVFVVDHVEELARRQAQNTGATTPVYQVASIKLNEAGTASLKTGKGIVMQNTTFTPTTFTAVNISMWELIRLAYRVEDYQVTGAPDWFSSELYDVEAKAGKSAVDEMQKLGNDQRDLESQHMLQALLTDHFKLTLHRETKELPAYSLVVAESGKLHEAPGDCGPHPNPIMVKPDTQPPPPCGSIRVFFWVGRLDGQKVPIKELATKLSEFTKRMVLDHTNLGGKYDLDLKWFPGPSEFPPRPAYLPPAYQPDPNSPPLLTAIQQQLGLKLESQSAPVELLVIDHAEMPSKN